MTMYRHLNLLIDGNIHDALRRFSRKQEVSISKIVRDAITDFLSAKAEESKEFPEGKGNHEQHRNS